MLHFHKPALAQLTFVREQIEKRLLGNQDYLALLALDHAICEFRTESMAKTQAVFEQWGAAQHSDAHPEDDPGVIRLSGLRGS
jgi:hypothetical protein